MTQIDTSTEAVEALLDGVTEGPFIVDDFGIERGYHCRIAMPDRHGVPMATVAECFQNWNATSANKRRISWKEAQANARFIAASRELVPALLAERDALRAEAEQLKARYNEVISERPYIVGWNDGFAFAGHGDETREVPDVVEALVDTRLKAQAVAVKPLIWGHHPAGTIASTGMGSAYIIDTRDTPRLRWVKWPGGHGPERDSLEEMKAAAQADYETRILSAITARTEDEVWNEAIEAAAIYHDKYLMTKTGIDVEQVVASTEAIRAIARPTKGVHHD